MLGDGWNIDSYSGIVLYHPGLDQQMYTLGLVFNGKKSFSTQVLILVVYLQGYISKIFPHHSMKTIRFCGILEMAIPVQKPTRAIFLKPRDFLTFPWK